MRSEFDAVAAHFGLAARCAVAILWPWGGISPGIRFGRSGILIGTPYD
jgi:hypothetical protein